MESSKQIALFGIPVDVLTMEQTLERIVAMRDSFQRDGRARLLATVNVDFIVNSLSFIPGRARHPELLEILCGADLVTADGMPLVWLSRLLGNPLPERVTGADLVPALAAISDEQSLSLFFLGGRTGIGDQAVEVLRQKYPDMRVAGITSPFVHTEGENMLLSEEEDNALVDEINAAKPDVLLVAFGNPKQEVWFNRNRHRLKVPVTAGIGGTFEFIAGTVKRAPVWMQKTGLEWIWRIAQDPKRLWKRYVVGLVKLALLSGILLFWNYVSVIFSRSGSAIVEKESVTLTGKVTDEVLHGVLSAMQHSGTTTLNISGVSHITPSALGQLIRCVHQERQQEHYIRTKPFSWWRRVYWYGVHAWVPLLTPMLSAPIGNPATTETSAKGSSQPAKRFAYTLNESGGAAVLILHGRLDASYKASLNLGQLTESLTGKAVIADVSNLSFADSSGIGLFLAIHNASLQAGQGLHVCGAQGAVKQMFSITKLDKVFGMHDTLDKARRAISTV